MEARRTHERATILTTWPASFRRQGFYFRQAAVVTILMGIYLHLTRVLLGDDDLLIEHDFTPNFDRVLTVPMAWAAITGLLAWRYIPFRSTRHMVAYALAWFYIASSVPLHVYNLNDSTGYLRSFPWWFSYLLFPVYAAIIWLYWRLPELAEPAGDRRSGRAPGRLWSRSPTTSRTAR